jgi:hypothetical protein
MFDHIKSEVVKAAKAPDGQQQQQNRLPRAVFQNQQNRSQDSQ